jgi:CheY-like chemotaxis protein
VEDHATSREILARLLRARGHDVATADSVAAGLKCARSSPSDIVISDLGLPDGDGCELMRTLRRESGIRGIALSGYGMASDVKKSKDAGFDVHLTKPVNVVELERALNDLAAEAGV